jgi:nucleoside-diphosphate-sugar epimerase
MYGDVEPASPVRLGAAQGLGRVVVFGGAGFAGRAIAHALTQQGFIATTAQRHKSRTDRSGFSVVCDATDARAVRTALAGADAVVNAVLGDPSSMIAVTRTLAEAADSRGLAFVHLSSMAVYGATRGPVDESSPLRGSGDYAEAKIACEEILGGSRAIILRPGLIYGPGDEQWTGRLFRLLRARRLGDLGEHGDGRCNLLYADDLGRLVAAALRHKTAEGQAVNLAHPSALRWNSVLIAAACAIGATPVTRIETWQLDAETRVLAAPLHAARLALRRAGIRRQPRWLPDAITPNLRRLFAMDAWLDTTLADRLLGVEQRPIPQGLHDSACWFQRVYGRERST